MNKIQSTSSVFRKIAEHESIKPVIRNLIQGLNQLENDYNYFDSMDKSDCIGYLRKISSDIEQLRWRRY